MPRALDSVVRMGRDATSAGALIIRVLEQFLRTTDGAIGAIHAPYWCDDNVAAAAGYAAEALWKNICKHNSTAPVTHDCYLKLFYLQGRELAPRDWTVMLDLFAHLCDVQEGPKITGSASCASGGHGDLRPRTTVLNGRGC